MNDLLGVLGSDPTSWEWELSWPSEMFLVLSQSSPKGQDWDDGRMRAKELFHPSTWKAIHPASELLTTKATHPSPKAGPSHARSLPSVK